MTSISQNNTRYLPHELKTRIHAVEKYRNGNSIVYVCRKYHISRTSLYRWNKKYDGTKESLIDSDLFKEGYIIAQDASSIRVGEVVNPSPGSSVLDACSAPGGKSLHMASIMENKGSITSCDVYEHKLNKIN